MKKIFSLLLVLIIMAGCSTKEKTYRQFLTGSWKVYKYTLRLTDKTSLYDGYTITFTDNGKMVERFVSGTDTSYAGGSYAFRNDDQVLALIDSVPVVIDTVVFSGIHERDYTILNLVGNHVQLLTDSSEIYLTKLLQ